MKTLVQALLQHEGRARVTLACCEDQVKPLKELFADRVGYRVFSMGWAMRNALRLRNAILPGTMPIAAQTALISFARLEQEIGADIIHSPVQLFSSGDFLIPGVVNVHDLQHLHYPDFFHESEIEKRNRQYGEAVALADAVIASSEYVRGDIIAHMDVPPHKVHTIPVTWNPEVTEGLERFSVEQARKHYALPDTYAIFPAQFWLHKNHARLVEALAIVRDKAPGYDLNLVFTGNRKHHNGWPQVEKALREHKMHEHVRCLDYVPNEHLAALYKGSLFCVMPSLFEASSYPVIEAQVLGVPAMCSDVTSLPELMLYNAGLLFNPLDPEDIAEKMLRWLKDDEDRLAHARRGRERAVQEHSMDAYTSRLLALYQDIVSS
jgi:glycosyltransferase involved in cell wall biosynthesis